MIHGVTIRRARSVRTTTEIRSAPTSTSGIASDRSRATVTSRDGGNSLGGDSAAKADVARPLRDVAKHRVADAGPPRALLKRHDVEVGYASETVLRARVLRRCRAHSVAQLRVGCETLENRGEHRHFAVADRHLRGDVVRQLGEPADVA